MVSRSGTSLTPGLFAIGRAQNSATLSGEWLLVKKYSTKKEK
jgi:hypothetical protein